MRAARAPRAIFFELQCSAPKWVVANEMATGDIQHEALPARQRASPLTATASARFLCTIWRMSDKKTLLLVDGSSYLYRAFHAMPDLRAVPGDPASPATGAIRGMINMMQALRKEVRADYAACVFDAKGPTFRDALYPEYKQQRSPMPVSYTHLTLPTNREV